MVNPALAVNQCAWLFSGSTQRCGARCCGRFCGLHNYSTKQRRPNGPQPCIGCGRGVKGKHPICIGCGAPQYRSAIEYLRRKNKPIPTVEEFFKSFREKQIAKQVPHRCEQPNSDPNAIK